MSRVRIPTSQRTADCFFKKLGMVDRSHRMNVNVTSGRSGGQILKSNEDGTSFFIKNFPWNGNAGGKNTSEQSHRTVPYSCSRYVWECHQKCWENSFKKPPENTERHEALSADSPPVLALHFHTTLNVQNVFKDSFQGWFKPISHLRIQHNVRLFTRHVGKH